MTPRRLLNGANDRLWKRAIARLACGARLVRPRAPLVLRRHRRAERSSTRSGPAVGPVEHQTALHLHFTLPPTPVESGMRRSMGTTSAVVDRVRVTNRALHHYLQRQTLEQRTLVHRPVLVSTSTSSLPAPQLAVDRRDGRDGGMRRANQARPHAATAGVPSPREPRLHSARRRHFSSHDNGHSQTAPRRSPALRTDIRRHVRRSLLAASSSDHTPTTQPSATHGIRASRHRATPVTFVRPLTARIGGAPMPLDATSAITTTLRNIERVTARTLETRVVQPASAQDVPASRVLHRPQEESPRQQAQPSTDRLPTPSPARPPAQPVIDVGRLSDEVYRHIQRRVRIERERRGG